MNQAQWDHFDSKPKENLGLELDLYHFADETKNSKLEEESNDGQ